MNDFDQILTESDEDRKFWMAKKYRRRLRKIDRKWLSKRLPASFLERFEVHHVWRGGRCVSILLLTPEEHHELHRIEHKYEIRIRQKIRDLVYETMEM